MARNADGLTTREEEPAEIQAKRAVPKTLIDAVDIVLE